MDDGRSTNSCIDPFYGPLCGPILETFPNHRHGSVQNFYTGRNFGSIEIQWNEHDETTRKGKGGDMNMMEISVHNVDGEKVLSTGSLPLCTFGSHMTEEQLESIVGVADGHLIPYLKKLTAVAILLSFLLVFLYRRVIRFRKRITLSTKKTV